MQGKYPFRFMGISTSAGQHDAAELDRELAASWARAVERDNGLGTAMNVNDEGGQDALTDLAMRLGRAEVRYALTGSAAGYFYGLNRSTADFDVLIDLAGDAVERVLRAFATGFYADEEMIREAATRGGSFNIISQTQGWKADFFPLAWDPLDPEALERAAIHDWHGTPIRVIDAADLVLNKLRWAKESGSLRQLNDVRVIMTSGAVTVDERFQRWVERFDLGDTLDSAAATGHDA